MEVDMTTYEFQTSLETSNIELDNDSELPGPHLFQSRARERRASGIVLDILTASMGHITPEHTSFFAKNVQRHGGLSWMAILWGRLHSYVARACELLIPTPIDVSNFDMAKELGEAKYFTELIASATSRNLLQKSGVHQRLAWTIEEERFHIMRGIEWFLDGHATVYDTVNGKKILLASLKHFFPVDWPFNVSFETTVQEHVPKLYINPKGDIIEWKTERTSYVRYHLHCIKEHFNKLRAEKVTRKRKQVELSSTPGTSNMTDDEEREWRAREDATWKETWGPERDVAMPTVFTLPFQFERDFFNAFENKFGKVQTDGLALLKQMLSSVRETVVKPAKILDNGYRAKVLVFVEKGTVPEENSIERKDFEQAYDKDIFGSSSPLTIESLNTLHVKAVEEANNQEEKLIERILLFEECQKEIKDLRAKVSGEIQQTSRTPGYSDSTFREQYYALGLKLSDILNNKLEMSEVEMKKLQKLLQKQNAAKKSIVAGTKTAEEFYNMIFNNPAPTLTTFQSKRRNSYTESPSKALSDQYQAKSQEIQSIFETLTKNRSSGSVNETVQKVDIAFDLTDSPFVVSMQRTQLAASNISSVKVADDLRKVHRSPNIPIYFCMAPAATAVIAKSHDTSMTNIDAENVNTIDALLDEAVKSRNGGNAVDWFNRLGVDGSVNQAWVVQTMEDDVMTTLGESDSNFAKVRKMSKRFKINSDDSGDYRTWGRTYNNSMKKMNTPDIAKMVFRFPRDSSKAETSTAALQTIMQYAYASAIGVGAKVCAMYVFDPKRLDVRDNNQTSPDSYGVLIIMERMPFKIKTDSELRVLSGEKDRKEYELYMQTEPGFLSRLWILAAKMSSYGMAFLDAHAENIYGIPSKKSTDDRIIMIPKVVDFDWRWGKVLHKDELIPLPEPVTTGPEDEPKIAALMAENKHLYPGWRPLYILNVLFIGFMLRIDDARSRTLPIWLSSKRSVNDAPTSSSIISWEKINPDLDRRTHIQIVIQNELEFMKSTGIGETRGETWNEVHKILGQAWRGGFWGGVRGIVNLPVGDTSSVHDFERVYTDDKLAFMAGGYKYDKFDKRAVAHPLTQPYLYEENTGDTIESMSTTGGLNWGAIVEFFSNGFEGPARRLRWALVNRQLYFNDALSQYESKNGLLDNEYNDDVTVGFNDYHRILEAADCKTREATMYYDAVVLKDGLRTMKRIYYIFKKRDDDLTFLELLSGFVLNPHEKFELPTGFDQSKFELCTFTPSATRITDKYKNITVYERVAALMKV